VDAKRNVNSNMSLKFPPVGSTSCSLLVNGSI